jgi:hypothetical protein
MGLALSIGLALLSTPAQAQVTIYSDNAGTVATGQTSVTMAQLQSGFSILVGDKFFNNWGGYTSTQSGTGLSVPAGDITITGIAAGTLNPGIQYNSADWTLTGVGTQDTNFNYTVSVRGSSNLIHDVSETLSQGTVGAGNGSNITITEGVATGPPPGGSPLTNPALVVNQVNTAGSFTNVLFDQQLINSVTSAYVAKDIGLKNTDGGTTAFSVLQQNFSQITAIPEPSTMAIAGLGALGFIGYGLRRRLKK